MHAKPDVKELFAFKEAHQTHLADKKLTPAGVRAADAEWADTHLPTLRERLVKISSISLPGS